MKFLKDIQAFWAAAIFALALGACATVEAPKTPQQAIDQTNVVLVAAAIQVRDNLAAKIMTKPEAQSALTRVKELAVMTDEAQRLLDKGLAIEAQDKVKLVNTLLTSLQREIAQKARETQ